MPQALTLQRNQQNMLWAPEKNNLHTVGRFLRRFIDCRTRVASAYRTSFALLYTCCALTETVRPKLSKRQPKEQRNVSRIDAQ